MRVSIGALTWMLLSAGLAEGAVRTWTGGGANDNWSLGANWGGTAPAPGDDIHFAGSTRLTPYNDITPGTSFNSISFDAGAGPFVVDGNAVSLSGGGSAMANANSGGIMTLNLAITLASPATFSNIVGGTLVLGGNIALGSYPLSVNVIGMTDLSGVISGTGSLVKSGNGPLKLSGSNTYAGATTVSAGVLIVNNASALGATAGGTTVAAGAALDLNGVNYSAAEALTLNGTGPGSTGALQNTSATTAMFGGQLSLGSASAIIGETGSISLTHSGAVSGGYPLTLAGSQGGSIAGGFNSANLTKAGTGSWSLENDDGFSLLTLSSGTLHLGSGRVHTVASSLSLNGGNLDFGSSTLEFQGSSADFSNLASIVPAGGTLSFSSASAQAFIPKAGAPFPAIVKNGAGALTLNSYGLVAQGLTMNGGNWDWSSYTHTLGSIASTSGMMLFNASTVEVTGNCDLSGLSSVAGTAAHLDFTGASAQTFTPVAGGSTHPHVRKVGAGTTTMAGNLTTSSLSVSGGTLDLAATSLIANSGLSITGGTLRADDASVSVYASVNVSGGVLRMPSGTMTVQQSFTLVSSGVVHNSGTLVMTSPSPGQVLDVDGALNNVTLNGSGGVWTVANHPLTLSGALTLSNGYLVLGNSLAHAVGSMNFAAGYLDFGTACTMAVTSGNADFSGLSTLTTVSGNTVSFTGSTGTQILTPRASGTHPGIIHSGASLLRLAGTGTYRGFAQSGGTLDFNGFNVATDNGGDFSISNGTPSTLQGLGGRNIVVAGNAAWAGASSASKLNLNPGSSWTLNVAGALSATFATLNYANASPTAGICSNCLEGGGNAGWSFPVTWDGGAGANHSWTAAVNWSSDAVPTSNQDVRFDATNSNDVNLDADQTVKSITLVSAYGGGFNFGNSTLSVQETADFRSGGSISAGTGALKFIGAAAQVFHPLASATFPIVIQDGAGGTTLSGAALWAKGLSIATGTFHFAGGTHILDAVATTGGGLDLGSGNFEFRLGDVNLAGLSSLTVATNSLAFTAASGTQTFTPNAAYGLYAIAKSGAGSVAVAANPLMAGSFSMSGGTWNWGASTLTHSLATLTATGGTMTFGSNIVKATGNVDLSGLAAINPGTGTLRFDGSGPQTFTPKAGAVHPAIDKSNVGTATLSANSLLAGALIVNGGTFDLGAGLNHAFTAVSATWGTLDFGSSTLRVTSGDADFSGLAGLTPGTGALEFTGTAAQNLKPRNGSNLPALKQNGTGGTTILAYGTTTPSIAIASGTLHLGAGLAHASGDFTSTGGGLDFQSSTLDLGGATLDFSGLTALTPATGTLGFQGASAQTFTPMASGVFPDLSKPGSGTVTAAGGFAAKTLSMSNGTLVLGSFSHSLTSFTATAGALDFDGSTLHVTDGQAYLAGLSALTPGAGTLDFSGTGSAQLFTPKSGATHPAITHTGSAILRLSNYALTSMGFSQSAGVLDFNNQNITTAGDFTIANGTPASFANLGGRTLTIVGNASLSGTNAANRLNLDPGTAWTIAVSSGTLGAAYAALSYSNASGAAGLCANCAESGGNANWSFSVNWDGGGADEYWSTADNWGSKSVPTSAQDVTFNAGSSKNVILSADAAVRSLDMTGYSGTLDFSSFKLTIAEGNADFGGSETLIASTGILEFAGSGSQIFHPKAAEVFPKLLKTGSGTTTVGAAALTAGDLLLSGGTFNLGAGMTHTVGSVSGTGALDFGTSNLNASGPIVNLSGLNLTATTSNTLAFTGTGAAFTPKSAVTDLNLTFAGSGTVTANGNFTTPALTLASGNLHLGTSLSHAIAAFSAAGGSLDFGSSILNTDAASMDFTALTAIAPATGMLRFTGAGAQTLTPHATSNLPDIQKTGNGTTTVITRGLKAGNVAPLAGTFHFGASLSHNLSAISMGGGPYGSLDFGSSQVHVTGNVDLGSLSALVPGTGSLRFDAAGGTQVFVPKSGGAAHPAIFHGGTGTLQLSTHDLTCLAFTQTAGTLDLNARNLTSAGPLSVTNGTAASFANLAGRTVTVTGNAVLNGTSSAAKLSLNPGSAWSLSVTGSIDATFAELGQSTAANAPGNCVGCVDLGGNSNWIFAVGWDGGGADGNWTSALNWTSDAVPGASEAVSFTSTSKNALLDADAAVKSIHFTGGYTGTFSFGTRTLGVHGDADFRSGGAIAAGTGTLALLGGSSHALIPKSGSPLPLIEQKDGGSTVIATNPLTSAGLTLTSGTLALGNAGLTHAVGAVTGSGTLDFGNSTLDVSGNVDVSLASVVPGTGTLKFTGGSAKTFSPKSGAVYPALHQSGTGLLTVAGNGFTAPSLTLSAGTLNLGAGLVHIATVYASFTGGGLDFGSSELRLAGSLVDFGGLASITPGAGTLTFNGASTQTLIPKAATALPAIAHTGAGTMNIAGNMIAPSFSIAAGDVNLGVGRTHALASFSATGGTLGFGTSTVNLGGGTADFSGLSVLNAAAGKIIFTAASGPQTFTPKTGALHPAIEHSGAGALIIAGADLLCASFLQQAGSLDFNGRNITVSGTGFFDILNGGSGTLINLGGRTLIVGGPATLMGQPANRLNLNPAAPWTLAVAGALKAVDADIRNNLASVSPGAAYSSANLSGNVNWTFLDTLKPENVTAFLATAVDGHSAALAWTASAASDADSVMLRYRTDGVPPQNPGDGVLWRNVSATVTEDTATGLADKTIFHFAAFARDSSGNFALKSGGSSDSAATPDVTAPAGVQAFTATAAGPTSVSLAWDPSSSQDVETIAIRYRADGAYPADATDGTFWKNLPASALAETVTGLAPNTIYHFAAFTRDSSGNVSPAAAEARDTALYQTPVSGSLSIADDQGSLKTPMAALAFTWSDADSLRFALPADTALAPWTGLRALDSLSLAAGPDGIRPILAQYKNIYGLRSPWYKDSTVLDRAAPVVTLAVKTDHGWRDWPDALAGKALDAVLGTDSVFVIRKRLADGAYFNGAGWTSVADTAKLRADSVFSVPMPNSAMATGAYDFTAFARDRIGNVSAPLTVRVNYAENRPPVLAAATLADSLDQNRQAAWTLDVGDPDAGDSLSTLSASLPAWLTLTEAPGAAQGGFPVRRIYSLAGKPQQADVGNATVTIQAADLGGRIFTYTKTIKVVDVNDPPVFAPDRDSVAAKEDSVSGYRPHFADADPGDAHTLALLQAPAWVAIRDSALVFNPGSRDAGMAAIRVTVSDGRLSDTLDLKIAVANVNDAPIAFPSSHWQAKPRWKEDVPDSFTVVVVDMDQGDPVSLATVLPAWIQYQASVDPVNGCNRFFRFTVNPKQADTGGLDLKLRFQDAAGAASELPFSARVAAVNDTPTAIIGERRSLAGAARIALDVSDQDGNAASSRFHYRLVSASGDTVRAGICASAVLALHPLADGAYRLAVRAEDEGGLKQSGFTVADLSITGATAAALDSGRWHMIGYPGRSLPASALGTGHALATWDESSGDGSPLGRYASGPASDSLARGKGYWVRVAKPVTLTAPQAGLLDRAFTLKLTHGRQGWNQIANPFPYYVDLSAAGLQFWEWDAVRRDLANAKGILKPWGAYWVQVSKDTTLTLRNEPYFLPAQAASGALAKASGPASPASAAIGASDWTLQMSLQAGPYQDRANYLGIRKVTQEGSSPRGAAASAGRTESQGRVPDAPKFGDYIALHFERPGIAGPGAKTAQGDSGRHATALGYAEDFRAGLGEDEEWWDFTVENSGTGLDRASLSLPGLDQVLASGLFVFLVKRGEANPLTAGEAGEAAILAMEDGVTHYSLVVTPHPDFARRLKGFFSLSQNFPNPVSAGTTFRFFLPQTWGADGKREAKAYRLRLNVYDYAGRLAARVADGTFAPGAHSLLWRPQGRGGNALAKGAYVYRLEIPGMAKTMKMIVK